VLKLHNIIYIYDTFPKLSSHSNPLISEILTELKFHPKLEQKQNKQVQRKCTVQNDLYALSALQLNTRK
jgi:hypothetical protein